VSASKKREIFAHSNANHRGGSFVATQWKRLDTGILGESSTTGGDFLTSDREKGDEYIVHIFHTSNVGDAKLMCQAKSNRTVKRTRCERAVFSGHMTAFDPCTWTVHRSGTKSSTLAPRMTLILIP